MGVERFRTFEAARSAAWLEPGDPRLGARIAWAWAWTEAMAREARPRGVQRFRTLEEANLERERRVGERVSLLRSERAGR